MNKNFLFLAFMGLLLCFTSCKDDNLKPIVTLDQLGKGAYTRLVELTNGEYDFQNIGTTTYEYTIEFVDEDQGNLVSQYDINVEFVDNNPDLPTAGHDVSGASRLYRSFSSSEFETNANGFKQLTVRVPLSELLTLFEITGDDLVAADLFNFACAVTTTDGRVFNFDNSTGAVNGSAFQGFFNNTVKVTCPMGDSQFTGDYLLEYVTDPSAVGFGVSIDPGVVTLRTVAGSTTKRAFDACYLPNYGCFNMEVQMDFVCFKVDMITSNSGVGCNDFLILRSTGESYPLADINDNNSVITLEYRETFSDCGGEDFVHVFTLTKV